MVEVMAVMEAVVAAAGLVALAAVMEAADRED
jgi:hypothetical protein